MAKGNSSSSKPSKDQNSDKKGSDKNVKSSNPKDKNSKDDTKNKSNNTAPTSKGSKDKGSDSAAPVVQEKPRWTGKTPVQYLNEYCQKNQMDKPIYEELKCKGGKFKYQIVLTFEGKKKQKTLKSYTTETPFDSVQEARAYSALVALYELCANTTIYKLFPPEFTSYWQQLDQQAKIESERLKIEQEEHQKLIESQEKPPTHQQVTPQIHLSEEAMRIVHSLVLELGIGNTSSSFEERKQLDEKENEIILSSLLELGFKEDHIKQALLNISNHTNIEGIIEWLCLNIPNSFLPHQFRPKILGLDKEKSDSVLLPVVSSSTSASSTIDINKQVYTRLKNEFESIGFLNKDIIKIIGISNLCNLETSSNEMDVFFKAYYKFFNLDNGSSGSESNINQDSIEQINDEQLALESIYMNNEIKFKKEINYYQYQYYGSSGSNEASSKLFTLNIYIPEFCNYPNQLPIITFSSNKTTPITNQIVVRSLLKELKDNSIGIPMIFNIIAWIDNNQSDILNNKLKLEPINIDQDIVTSTSSTSSPSSSTSSLSSSLSDLSINSSVSSSSSSNKSTNNKKNFDYNIKLNDQEKNKVNKDLLEQYETILKKDLESKSSVYKKRQSLPVYKRKEAFLKALESNQVLVVTAETGCGKSTQIPQYILESFVKSGKGSECNIICTQPRRISAIGVAERVSYEWNCGDNSSIGKMIGYQIRNESKRSNSTRLLFCTTGILLRRILDVNNISNVSHIIIDEVHERSTDNDFLLIILREIISKRKDLKIILMSATLNAIQISNYFKCNQDSIFSIEGFTYPVRNIYIDEILNNLNKYNPNYKDTSTISTTSTTTTTTTDNSNQELELKLNQFKINIEQKRINYDIVESLILYLVSNVIKKDKSILVFLPGLGDILELCSRLSKPVNSFTESICNKIWCVPLHSSLSPTDQQKVFESAPNGKVKVVLSTNIAETSITIEDIEIVVDCGRVNQMSYNSITRVSVMEETWTSKASCRQRAGRAGRTSSGLCYKVFTKSMESQFQDQDTPEILRTSLQQLCLHVKLFIGNDSASKTTIQQFISKAIEPPSNQQIQSSINELVSIDALQIINDNIKQQHQILTPLGYHLASLPVDVYIGKMLLFGCIFRCIDPILTIAATLSSKSPFIPPSDKKIRPHQKFAHHQSDQLMFVNVYNQWRKSIADGNEYQFCKENYLSVSTLRTIQDLKIQFVEVLSEIGFLPSGITIKKMIKYQKENKLNGTDGIDDICGYIYNSNSQKIKIINAVLAAGMYPKIGRIDLPESKYSQTASGAIKNKYQPEDLMIQTKLPPSSSSSSSSSPFELERVFVHPRSININEGDYVYPFIIYNDKVKTSRMFIHHITNLSPLTLLLFSLGGLIEIDKSYQEITLDHWLKFKATSGKIIVLLKEIRILFNHLLKKKIEQPNYSTSTSIIIDIITKLVLSEGYL